MTRYEHCTIWFSRKTKEVYSTVGEEMIKGRLK